MMEILRQFSPDFSHVEEAPISTEGKTIGWHSTFLGKDGLALGGGCGSTLELSRRIAVAEIIERSTFQKLMSQDKTSFLLDEFPTSCGFAAGFESEPTKLRAISESLERWALSKWIDDKLKLEPIHNSSAQLGEIGFFFAKQFDELNMYAKTFALSSGEISIHIQFGAVVGFKNGGAFLGSRACSTKENPWDHALTEAWRHTVIAKSVPSEKEINKKYKDRVRFFASNALAARTAINEAHFESNWPVPRLRLLKQVPSLPDGIFVWRALCHDYKGWHLGDETRFMY